jgi:UDP-N-acetylmuramate dehydrogenase
MEQIPLAPLTMFQIGGAAKYFIEAHTDEEVLEGVCFAAVQHTPYFILGGGSNILVADSGWDGLVIQMRTENITWQDNDTLLILDAGVSWDSAVEASVLKERGGLENLSGIPGSVGGAVAGNIGAYGSEVKKTIVWVEALDVAQQIVVRLNANDCKFGYRDSIFKHEAGKQLIILRAAFQLRHEAPLDKAYKDIASYEAEESPIETLTAMRSAVLAIRGRKFPKGGVVGTAGSYFKNPVVTIAFAEEFKKRFPEAPMFADASGMMKLSAAWIIDHVLNMRGVRDGQVGTWEGQALVLVNYGGAKASDVMQFAKTIITRALTETGVTLVPEVIFIGA